MSRILVVEDEPAIAELISINLRHAGFEVTIAGDAEQAQVAVDGILPSLVVLDWMLPGQSGLALARAWRAQPRTRELPIIMLTARADEGDKVAGLDAGADDYLAKPFSASELLARIRAVLRRRSPEALDAFARLDVERAVEVLKKDDLIDQEFEGLLRKLITFMMEDPRTISSSIDLVFVAKAIERVGDHAKNLAEQIIYIVKGMDVRHNPVGMVESLVR